MGTFIQARIEAGSVVEAMLNDSDFALDMWWAIVRSLDDGLLLDNAADLAATGALTKGECRIACEVFRALADTFDLPGKGGAS